MSTFDSAMEAFQSLESDSGEENQQTPSAAPVDAEPQTPPSEPASKAIDISGLPEEAQVYIRAREREMQADYTRKTQEAAQQRQEAEQALRFIDALNSDPDFAYNVLNQLQTQLGQSGYDFYEEPSFESEVLTDEWGNEIGPDPYAEKLAEIEAWKNQMENEWLTANLSAQIDRQLATIQQQHSDWDDNDLQNVIDLGFVTNGDLHKAAEQYQAILDHSLSKYLERKGSINTPAPLPHGSAQPVQPTLSTEEERRAAAMEIIRNSLE